MLSHETTSPTEDIKKILPLLDNIPILAGLSEVNLFQILQRLKRVSYAAGETIFKEGDCASYIYIVETGRVKLIFSHQSFTLTKAELLPGSCFGETSVIGIQPHSATTVAMEDSDLLVLSGDVLSELFDEDKELFSILILNIARESCRRLYKTNKQLVEYLSLNVDSADADIQGY